MLTITLYSNCRLNNSYKNVFAGGKMVNGQPKTFLELYLNSLAKFSFQCDSVYYENSGEIVIDQFLFTPVKSIYEYNYMKVDFVDDENNTKKFTRYCFIESIKNKNGCVYISYEEDIWNSFQNFIQGINSSYLSNTRVWQYTNFTPKIMELPIDYDGNNKIIIQGLKSNFSFYILVQLQVYDLVDMYKYQYSEIKYFLFRRTAHNYFDLITGVESIIQDLVKYQINGFIDQHNYEIGNIYLLNYDIFYNQQSITFGTEKAVQIKEFNQQTQQDEFVNTDIRCKEITIANNTLEGIEICSGTIHNNYKNLSFGTMDNQLKIINNGTSINYSVYLFITDTNVALQLRALNTIVDITKSFEYQIPYKSITSSEHMQRRIANQIELFKEELGKEQSKISGILGISELLFDVASGLGNLVFYSSFKSKASGLETSGRNVLTHVKQVAYGLTDDQYIANANISAITYPKYSNTKGIIANSSAVTNYAYGICLLQIDDDNGNFVKDYINNFGYKVYEFINDYSKLEINKLFTGAQSYNYNFIKFDYIDIYGYFPRDIARSLNAIFTSGVKIWYNENMTDDNYVV